MLKQTKYIKQQLYIHIENVGLRRSQKIPGTGIKRLLGIEEKRQSNGRRRGSTCSFTGNFPAYGMGD